MISPAGWRDLDLVCPACRGELAEEPGRPGEPRLRCRSCRAAYPVVLDIPDLRTRPDPYIGPEEDRAKGRKLAEACRGLSLPEALDIYYRLTSVVTDAQAKAFTASVLSAGDRARDTLDSVETRAGRPEGRLLDLGCGTAPLAVHASERYAGVVGVDVAFRWLVMARFRLTDAGVRVPLICACAEALPFPDRTFVRVVGESAIEHFEDQALALHETLRVLEPGGDLYLTTPNRFSLGPDPHVGLPAGGYLPERWVAAYIRRRGGVPPRRRLLSATGLRRRLAEAGFRGVAIGVPPLGDERVAGLRGVLGLAASAYQAARKVRPLRAILRRIGPLLEATAVRPDDGAGPPERARALTAAEERGG